MNNKDYMIKVFMAFVILAMILYYSYRYKLGYLKITTYLLFFLALVAILINVYLNKGSYRLLWILLFLMFLYGLLDKYLRVHIIISRRLSNFLHMDTVMFVNILYIVVFIAVMSFFGRLFIEEFKKNPEWIYLFTFAILLKIVAIFSDFWFHDITEDYFEVFSLYFFASSFLSVATKNNKTNKK